uniref:FAD:protein FMN transferase n=1 Tax=Solibacter usitatus (strain Ellin6076) TaxID=234267 RepID=Q01UT1_SOLUE
MKKLLFTLTGAGLLAFFLGSSTGASTGPDRAGRPFTYNYENVLGTSLELKVLAGSEAVADKAEAAALAEIDREAKILSAWDSASEFSRWSHGVGRPERLSPELLEVLGLFDQWRERSGGALDASAEAVTRVWKQAAAERRMPAPAELAAAVTAVKGRHWELDTAHGTATHLDRTPLALNSFAKSFIVGRAADAALTTEGVTAAVVNIGGDLVVRGNWTEPVSVADPKSDAENAEPIARLRIRNAAVATSGNYRRGVEIAGRHYSHIVDPRTGQPVDHVISATVVALNAADAGALATTMCVLQPEESKRLAERTPGVEYLLVASDGTRIASSGWKRLQAPGVAMSPVPPPAPAAATWDPAFELAIDLEIARIQDMRARRPYVAVWIEDADKFPVRTVALWFQRPRWLPELRAWYRSDRLRATTEGNDITSSISSATRPPGKYKLKWDGKDNKGNLVKAGKYTVFIEAAREHGTYQIMRHEMDFNGTPQEAQLPGGTEISAASLAYRKM